jgi:hypothetical protein
MNFFDILKNGVIYKHLKHPFSVPDVLQFFATVPIGQTRHDETTVQQNITRLVSEQQLIKMGAFPFYFFPDIPVLDSAYLATMLKSLLIKIKMAQ